MLSGMDPGERRSEQVQLGAEATAIATGGVHTCVITIDQTQRCWGSNRHGELGYGHAEIIGDDEQPSSAGEVDLGGDKVIALALASESTCVLVAPDRVRCWGRDDFGQLGQGNTIDIGCAELPGAVEPIDLGASITQSSAGFGHQCARAGDGTLRCWGWNEYGQLGHGGIADIGDAPAPTWTGLSLLERCSMKRTPRPPSGARRPLRQDVP